MKTKPDVLLAIAVLQLLSLAACKPVQVAEKPFDYHADRAPAYDSLYYWAAHPAKDDPSDHPPEPVENEPADTGIAVFFVHPTTYLGGEAIAGLPEAGREWNASLQNEALNKSTDESSIKNQATPFSRPDPG